MYNVFAGKKSDKESLRETANELKETAQEFGREIVSSLCTLIDLKKQEIELAKGVSTDLSVKKN